MDIETTPHAPSMKHICFQKYRSRWFLNKQVALVLFLVFLLWVYMGSYLTGGGGFGLVASVSAQVGFSPGIEKYFYFPLVSTLSFTLTGFFSAWIAGWKYRINDIVFTGMVISAIGILMNSIFDIVISIKGADSNSVWGRISYSVVLVAIYSGSGPVLANLFQLAMEQIPEASASQMSSLVNWLVFTAVLGSWTSTFMTHICACFLNLSSTSVDNKVVLHGFLVATVIALALSTYALLKHRLMDNSPSSNVINNIYKVIKYAIQHKHPQHRSAMTYWEERIPSRLALGKAKYGGPFTSEQVEDVRTFIQIGALYLAVFFYLNILYLNEFSLYYIDFQIKGNRTLYLNMPITNCYTYNIWYHFAGYNYWWLLVSILIYEFLLVPVMGYRMPSMLSRVTLSTLLAMLISIIITILIIINSYSTKSYTVSWLGLQVGLSLPMGVARAIFYTAGLEFLCAQSPYAMRNFFITLGICVGWLSPVLTGLIFTLWAKYCNSHVSCPVIYSTITMALHVVGLAVFWGTMRKYRKRSRGHEDEHQQKWVEEVYDKYVEQEENYEQEQAFID